MTDLRWVLLALGILVIGAVYLWSQGIVKRWLAPFAALHKAKAPGRARVEPAVGNVDPARNDDPATEEQPGPTAVPADKIITLRFVPSEKEIACDQVILALRAAGLKHGRYGIFHKHASELNDEPMFSVANLTEPGSFEISNLTETKIPGMSFFMILPGEGDPIERFDAMVATARELARDLDGELRDDKGSSWSIQRERYVREEIIEYCHLLDKPLPDE